MFAIMSGGFIVVNRISRIMEVWVGRRVTNSCLRERRYWVTLKPYSHGESPMQLQSTLTCPKCGHGSVETMPTDACQFFYDCKGCGERLKPLAGDCCVFCSYGSVPCPPIQENKRCC
jgi:hypothetical protein